MILEGERGLVIDRHVTHFIVMLSPPLAKVLCIQRMERHV